MRELQLRRARESRGLTLGDIAHRTGTRAALLEFIDRGDVQALPSGLYGRAAVRSYARVVGLDPDEVLADLAGMLPEVEDPLDGLARVRGIARRPRPSAVVPVRPAKLVEPARAFRGGEPAEAQPGRAAAAIAVDAALLSAIGAGLLLICAAATGRPVHALPAAAAEPLAVILLSIAAAYFVLLGGVRRQTVGARVAGWADPEAEPGCDAHAILVRAGRWAIRDSSIVVDWLIRSPRLARLGHGQWAMGK